jgi:hypothetical protein
MKMRYIMRSRPCPVCGSTNILRSKREGLSEQVACRISPVRPFCCNSCDARVYAVQSTSKTPLESPEGRSEVIPYRFAHRSTRRIPVAITLLSRSAHRWESFNDSVRAKRRFKVSSLRRRTLRGRGELLRLRQTETSYEIVDASRDSIERGDVSGDGGMLHVSCRKNCTHFRYHSEHAQEKFVLELL